MICDSFENAYKYESVIPNLGAVLAAAREIGKGTFTAGRQPMDGENVFLNKMTYDTHPVKGATAEAHRLYADVMVVNAGKEAVYVGGAEALSEMTVEYDPAKECYLGVIDESRATKAVLTQGRFLVIFPEEVHAPGCDAEGKETVEKIVGKIKLA